MFDPWGRPTPGLLALPSGRLVRGRALRRPLPDGAPTEGAPTDGAPTDGAPPDGQLPEFGLYATGRRPPATGWASRWVCWPDFWLPLDRDAAQAAIVEAWQRAEYQRVEVGCGGGRGRTGTVLACLAVLDGVPASDAVDFVRGNYSPHAVETPWQRRYVRTFAP